MNQLNRQWNECKLSNTHWNSTRKLKLHCDHLLAGLRTLDPSVESAGALACAVLFAPFFGSATAEEEDEEDEVAGDFGTLARAVNAEGSLSSTSSSNSSASPSGEVVFVSDGDAFSGLGSLLEDCFCLFEFSLPTEDNRKVLEARSKNILNELIYLPWASSPGVLGSTN